MVELFYSPIFWVAMNAMIAVAILQLVRSLRGKRAERRATRERFAEVKALLQSRGAGREHAIKIVRALVTELRNDGIMGVRSSMTFREVVTLVTSRLGSSDSFDDLIRTFEDIRYGGMEPSAEDLRAFEQRIGELIELLERSTSSAHGEPRRSQDAG
ncbi:MAG: DUF4129 domain-containing protein [Thaumarchaeota archaeon]|nr:DUF4129 domain-containing protein [Candidatus Calditenuaceae archaeon]MDW8042185.1 DUF4129 domain-containing protein [Nitrososphaerota archaeon]